MAFSLLSQARRQLENLSDSSAIARTAANVGVGFASPIDQPQLSYMWEVSFNGIFASEGQNLQFYARDTAIPAISTERITRYYAGSAYSISGKDNSPRELRITFWDNQSHDVYNFFRDWIHTTNDTFEGRKVNPQNYKRNIAIRLKDTSDLLINGEFNFTGCFPIELGEVSLSYSESEVMQFDVTFSYDSNYASGEASSVISQGLDAAGNVISGVVSSAIEGLKRWF